MHPDVKFYFPIPNYELDINGLVKKPGEWKNYLEYIETKKSTPWKDYSFDKLTDDGIEQTKAVAIRIEQVRALNSDILLGRFEGNKKVCIIENFDMMTLQATNSFLKTLEEPPADTLFLLTVTNLNNILPTILSRCVSVEFYKIPTDTLENYLLQNGVDHQTARLNANLVNGNFERLITRFKEPLENDETMELTLKFLKFTIEHDDLSFLNWMDDYFSRTTQKAHYFKEFIQYLTLFVNDLHLYSIQSDRVVFIDQIELIQEYINKNPIFLEYLPDLVLHLDDFLQKHLGNVNIRFILPQVYDKLTKVF